MKIRPLRSVSVTATFLYVIGTTLASGFAGETYADVIEADHPVAWYRFADEGARVSDRSGFHIDGKIDGKVTTGDEGPDLAGETETFAANFQGGSIDLGHKLKRSLNQKPAISIEAWFNAPLPGATRDNRPIIFVPIHLEVVGATLVLTKIGRDNIGVGGRSSRFEEYHFVTGSADLRPNEWNHIVGILDFQHGQIRAYVNGVEVIVAAKAEFARESFSTYKSEQSSADLIGLISSTNERFEGQLAEVAIYDYALDDPDGDGDSADSRIGVHAELGPR